MPKVRILITKLVQTLHEVDVEEDELEDVVEGVISAEEVAGRDEAVLLQQNENLENDEVFTEDDPDFNTYLIH